jgi:proton-translocating NADH-quinone oxidoreductase chain N
MNPPAFIWIIGIPLIASPFIYFSGHLGNSQRGWSLSQAAGLVALLAAWVPFLQSASTLQQSTSVSFSLGSISLCFDGISLLLAGVTLALGTLVVLYSGPYLRAEVGQDKFYAMLVAMIGVMVGLGCACDLFNLWIWFEAMAIASYLLVAFYRQQGPSLEAGIKYLVQSASGSVLVLIGISLVLMETGTVNLGEIRSYSGSSPALLAAGALFIIGFGVKAALVPMHTWLPDAHSQAPSGISAMLSGVVIEAGLIAMLRSLAALSAITTIWGPVLMGFGAINMLAGNLLALKQKQIKRLLAFSSLAHVGYMLAGIGIAIYAQQLDGAQGGLFHLLNHGMMKGLAFLAAGTLLYTLHIASGSHGALTVDELSGAAQRYPLVAFAFSLAVLGLGGIPPLAGFMSKWQIVISGFETHNLVILLLAIFIALNSVLSLAYYAPLVNTIYRRGQSTAVRLGSPVPVSMTIPLVGLSIFVVLVGVWPTLTSWLISPASTALLSAFTR